ncbi:[protein-PII] uridylyltransferase [Sulfuriroseicoccus oceanibius]|uniref:Bifunctional uridylyltransferase/uridylyl-removing enzyme n=1 Tax=Sulfuriroseicoccus oceanibius TaxID=2707525 RepID=A0A6B3L2F5_9BACT|nr:[protein-PII] uridylyltransferase [Sulfuriroseicoccus oceanibius]QQL44015.1 [protein-PII] uridylyltransferase [Sulfuriroseicoccus oceanibius]
MTAADSSDNTDSTAIQDPCAWVEQQLAAASPEQLANHNDRVALLKQVLKTGEEVIKRIHLEGAPGMEVCKLRSCMIDLILRRVFDDAMVDIDPQSKTNLTLVATGGYGRGMLNPFSDIDILFLHSDKIKQLDAPSQDAVESVLYLLWDIGLKVGHATRSVKGCVQIGLEDFQTLSCFIESRLIAGDPALFDLFTEKVRNQCINGREDAYLANRFEDLDTRHERSFGTLYVQEPNLKSGVGALRDIHNIIWINYVKHQTLDLNELVNKGLLTAESLDILNEGHDFLLRVRNDLHYEEGRSRDVLTLFLQGVVATHFNYPQRSILRRCEAFMRDYYHQTRSIREITSQVMEGFQIESERKKHTGIISFLARRKEERESFDGFFSEGERLFAEHDDIFREDPARLIRMFQHTQLRHLRLSPNLKDLIAASLDLIDRPFRYNKAHRETFLAILSRRGDVSRTLRQMHRVGFLGKYIPEFGALDCMVQHEFFHRYTADEHTLRCIDMLDSLSEPQNEEQKRFAEIFNRLEDPAVLYLSMLLHDTGRAENARHHEDASALLSSKVCNRLQIKSGRRRLLIFLVDHHLTLWKTATTKNLEDPNTIADFAKVIRSSEYLRYLYLLTYADSNGTSSESWNSWKATLMAQLFKYTINYFENTKAFEERLAIIDPKLREQVLRKLSPGYAEEVDAHIENMPTRYLQSRKVSTIAEHIRVFRKFFEKLHRSDGSALNPAFTWQHREDQGSSKVIVCSWNRENLLARIAACLSALNLNILAADIYTRKDGLALDLFRVCTTNLGPVTNERTLKEFEKLMNQVFSADQIDMAKFIALGEQRQLKRKQDLPQFPQRVLISNKVDPNTTFVEIQALDRLALLTDIFTVFGEMKCEVAHARINTTRGAAIDTFYITEPNGDKITNETKLRDVQNRLEEKLDIPHEV